MESVSIIRFEHRLRNHDFGILRQPVLNRTVIAQNRGVHELRTVRLPQGAPAERDPAVRTTPISTCFAQSEMYLHIEPKTTPDDRRHKRTVEAGARSPRCEYTGKHKGTAKGRQRRRPGPTPGERWQIQRLAMVPDSRRFQKEAEDFTRGDHSFAVNGHG